MAGRVDPMRPGVEVIVIQMYGAIAAEWSSGEVVGE